MNIRTGAKTKIAQNGPIFGQIVRLRLGLRLGLGLEHDGSYV